MLKAPFPWFGGKCRVAHLVWDRFGNVQNYVEPFFGSGAVLLNRPHEPQTETVNDLDCFLSNFWRALRFEPQELSELSDWPVNEADLLARHKWLMQQDDFRAKMRSDPHFYDVKIAGWWVWGLCAWIGSGWCVHRGEGHQPEQLPHLGDAGMGINAGRGKRIGEYFAALSSRLRGVRVCCGEWSRCLGDSVTIRNGLTGVFLDPPYSSNEHDIKYSENSDVAATVRQWAVDNARNRQLRIALCGYDGEHDMPADWECVAWKNSGGYGSQGYGRGRENSSRERIWFSPSCVRPPSLFNWQDYDGLRRKHEDELMEEALGAPSLD